MKTKQSVKKKRLPSQDNEYTCGNTGCNKDDASLIECECCKTWVSEECNIIDINGIAKLLEKFLQLHLFCKDCDNKAMNAVAEDSSSTNEVLMDSFSTRFIFN